MGGEDGGKRDSEDGVGDGFDVLNFIDFHWDMVSPSEMSGRFVVKPKSSQPFGVLHGGITAFLAETLASLGAQIVSRWARVAGIDLTVSHLQSAPVGSEVIAKAVPLRVGKRVQVWDVTFTTLNKKASSSNEEQQFTTVAVARLSVIVGLPDPETGRKGNEKLIAIAREKNVELFPLMNSKL
ncbi:hypothetical protein M758_12G054000 [Ceratodon purpureus]|uniref:Thioesterase domain-containing protein n=1 Tax=Ceratodon purpureus TaxID=3225 RepID=A0A8T0G4X3_CERPU|nr:hypothetical protein KC19_12G051400 [Ceratodon purpureus]KAG0598196.1 hypothetical protein M758_12G054000 [Ceratodon purpureus]